jgi:hypothetical protein
MPALLCQAVSTAIPCRGAGRSTHTEGNGSSTAQVRLEAVVPEDVSDRILDYLRSDIAPTHHITVCKETVEVLRQASFLCRVESQQRNE